MTALSYGTIEVLAYLLVFALLFRCCINCSTGRNSIRRRALFLSLTAKVPAPSYPMGEIQ